MIREIVNYAFVTLLFGVPLASSLALLVPTIARSATAGTSKKAENHDLGCFATIGILPLIVIAPMTIGAIARGESSAWPFHAFEIGCNRGGMLEGFVAFTASFSTSLWAFLIPGHLYSVSIEKRTGKRPRYPYVINVLIGLILSIPDNPIYKLIEALVKN